jgi:hypothetical protein
MIINMNGISRSYLLSESLRLNRSTKVWKEVNKMDLWFIIKERYVLLSIILIIIFISLFFLIVTWKKHSNVPKGLLVVITTICFVIILLSILALAFAVSFGYNS